MLHLVLPIVSGLAGHPAQDLSDPIGELIPEDAFAAVRIASIDEFSRVFGELDRVLAPDDPSSPDDALGFILNLDPDQIRADLPIVMTVSSGGQGVARGFVVPVHDHEAFNVHIREFIGADATVEHIGSYAGYMMGADYVAGGSKIGDSWPVSTPDGPVVFARVDMLAVESTFGPLISQGLAMMEMAMAETPQPKGNPIDMSAMAEIAADLAGTFIESAETMDIALDVRSGTVSLSSELLVREGSDMAGLGSSAAPAYSKVLGAVSTDSALQILGHIEDDKFRQWFEPLAEFTESMTPGFPHSTTDLDNWMKHADKLGNAMAVSMDFDAGAPSVSMVYELMDDESDFFQDLQQLVKTGATVRGAEVRVLDPLVLHGVTVTQIATVEPKGPAEPAVRGALAVADMTANFARSGGRVLMSAMPSNAAPSSTKLAAQIALLKSPQPDASPLGVAIDALGSANPSMAMTVNLNALIPQLVASGEVAEADAPTFEGDAVIQMHAGVAGRHWLGHVGIPLHVIKAMNDLGPR